MKKIDYIQFLCEKKLKELSLHENVQYVQALERELTNVNVQDLHDYILNLIKNNTKIEKHGSLMYYLLDISSIDPIKNNISIKIKKQSSFPDIDSDFSINERELVVKYFINKYGNDHVAPIGSYGQMKMKSVLRDIARILDIDIQDTNDVVKNLGDDVDEMPEEVFDAALMVEKGHEDFRQDLYDLRLYLNRHPKIREILFKLKGQLRHLTKHPAGVVATPGKIDETIPLMRHKNELITSWVDGIIRKDLQSSGFIKFDILGLKTLTILKEIIELIRLKNVYNEEADFDLRSIDKQQITSLYYEELSSKMPLDGNDVVYKKFRETDTNGIFQFECIAGNAWVGRYRISNLYNKFVNNEKITKISGINLTSRNKKKIRQRIFAMKKQEREVYRLVIDFDNSRCIDATLLHKFFTTSGWKTLQELKVGDKILIDQERCSSQFYCEQFDIAVDEPMFSKPCVACVKNKMNNCTSKTVFFAKDFNSYDMIPIFVDKRKRKILSARKYKPFSRKMFRFKYVKIKLIKLVGIRDVYDIGFKPDTKYHNYVANGFVVHNSNLMKSLLKEIQPTTFSDITTVTALGRPGPLDMGMHHEYAKRKKGEYFKYDSALVEKCLKSSYGILVYQEDVMRLCHMVAGFPLDLTDTVRKNLMKSIRDTDAKDKEAKQRKEIHKKFIDGCISIGNLTEASAENLWQNCVSFARYGFNRCLTGDTVVTRCNGNQHTKSGVTISELYFLMRSDERVGRKYRRSGYPKIHSMINGRVKIDKIKDIIYNGKKEVFKITTENGFSIKATSNHIFLSENGWLQVKDFNINDLIAITLQEYEGRKLKGLSSRVKGKTYINDEPGFGKGENNPAYVDGSSIVRHKNVKDLKAIHHNCQDCNRSHKRLEVHHKKRLIEFEYNRITYNDKSNLIVVCPSCHKKRHYEQGRTKRYEKGFEIIYSKIVSIELIGIDDVYDVEMYGEEHNFVANGFISHNSHAVSYTILSYQMMWFKIYYPLEFYVVLLSNSVKEKFISYFGEIISHGINIVTANINTAKEGFSIYGNEQSIMFGLGHINGVGPAVISNILQTQPYDSFEDFYEKTSQIKKITKTAMTSLIDGHAFDCFGNQNEILEKYFINLRKDKKWQREVDYNDKKFEHERFVEAYTIDWRTKLSDYQKANISKLKAVTLTKFMQPKINMKSVVWGIISEIVEKKSKNDNSYYYVVLTDSKFNVVKLRIPSYNRRCQTAFLLNSENDKYLKVSIDEIIKTDNILVGSAETSEYMGRIFIDLYDICCVGNVYEKTKEQKLKLEKYDKMAND